MRIFVSSSYTDLREHRLAAIRVLRQMGHEIEAMEDMVSSDAAPLQKVMAMVDRSDAYVGLFAWRYGYVPKAQRSPPARRRAAGPGAAAPGDVPDGQHSITHYEYLRAKHRQIPVLAFLLEPGVPWSLGLTDGVSLDSERPARDNRRIVELRAQLQQERVISWFSTPADLEARVAAAVSVAGLTRHLKVNLLETTALGGGSGPVSDSSATVGIVGAIKSVVADQRGLKVDLAQTWWSTRLFLAAAMAEHLTPVRRLVIVRSDADGGERFIGLLSTSEVLRRIGPTLPALGNYGRWLAGRSRDYRQLDAEIVELVGQWNMAFSRPRTQPAESAQQTPVTPEMLERWFGDALARQAVEVDDLGRPSVVDILRLLDYPNEFVPVTGSQGRASVELLDKTALNARLAHAYLSELKQRAQIR